MEALPHHTPRVAIRDASAVRTAMNDVLSDPLVPLHELPSRLEAAAAAAPQPLVRTGADPATGDTVIDTAFENAARVDAYLGSVLGRNGWDGKGGTITVRVNYPSDNANWEYRDHSYWVGDRGAGASLGAALDVTAHEIVHGIYQHDVYASDAESQTFVPDVWQRAVDESFADVIAAGIDADDWTMGEDVGDPQLVRDLERPQLRHMDDVDTSSLIDTTGPSASHIGSDGPRLGEHALSGIASLAAVRASQTMGRQPMVKTWYHALADHLGPNDRFPEAASATIAAAQELFGPSAPQVLAVRDAWTSVGVEPAATPS